MQFKLAIKAAIIAALLVTLQLSLWMILEQIQDRRSLQREVVQNIADSAAGPQTLIGPVLLVEYKEEMTETVTDKETGQTQAKTRIVSRSQIIAPEQLNIRGDANVETRKRGIYHANLFYSRWNIEGHIAVEPNLGSENGQRMRDARAYLILGINDQRGITNSPSVTINEKSYGFQVGSRNVLESPAIYAELGPFNIQQGAKIHLQIPLELMGSQYLSIAPTAELTQVTMQSAWPHPSFQGRFLPKTRTIDASGFTAEWQISHLARRFDAALAAGQDTYKYNEQAEVLRVNFHDPVNVYVQSERAVKYGMLFILLTFAAFFLIETTRRLSIHPVQYLLVGLALAIFFLLLVSLSEQWAFWLSYAIAASACVALISVYLGSVLGNRWHGFAFGAGITALYGILYGILLSEDNALLMGSLLLFAALAAVMIGTRHINWYQITRTNQHSNNAAAHLPHDAGESHAR